SDSGFSPRIGRSRSAPSHAAPAASSLEAMAPACARGTRKSRFVFLAALIRVACITKRDPVPDHWSPAEKAGTLHGVLPESIAQRVDAGLQAHLARWCERRKQVELACLIVHKVGKAHAQ